MCVGVCVCMSCALGMYRKTLGGEMGIKSNAALIQNLLVLFYTRLDTSCTGDNVNFWRKKRCPSCVFQTCSFSTDALYCE